MNAADRNEATVRRIYEEGYNRGDESVLDHTLAADFVHHSKVLHDVAPGVAGEKESMRRFCAAVPDVAFRILGVLATDEWVVARLTIVGTPVSSFGTLDTAGRPLCQHVLSLFHLRNGLATEQWLFVDAADEPELGPAGKGL